MALRVWLPLNGTIENKGSANITVNNNGASVNTTGKIGNCYSFNNNSIYGDYFEINNLTQISGCCWVYLTNLNSAQYFMHLGGQASYPCKFSIDYEGGIRFQINGTEHNSSITLTTNTWYHIIVTWNGSIAKLYVNGIEKFSKTVTGNFNASNHFAIGARTNGTAGTTFAYGITNAGKLNDIRIYDHCLSPLEVKEISQGLILHYKMSEFQEGHGNPNLGNTSANYSNQTYNTTINAYSWGGDAGTVTFYSSGGYNGLPYKHYHKTATGSGGIYKKTADDIVIESGVTYTMSCWIKADRQFTASNYSFNINRGVGNRYITYNSGFIIYTDWHYYTKTFTATDDDAGNYGEMSIIYDDNVTDYNVYYSGFKIEKGSVATEWCSPSALFKTIQDNSGYNNNGSITNTITLSEDTPRYNSSMHLSKARVTSSTGFPVGNNPNFTIAFWAKIFSTVTYVSYGDLCGMYDTGQGSNTFRLELCGSPAGNNLMWFRGPSGQSGGGFNMNSSSSSGWFSKDIWHHIALSGDGINKLYYCYLDGYLCQTYNGSANSWSPTGQIYIGDTAEATADFSDFRVYCTTLSAEDILSLYQKRMAIDNLQNIHTIELSEENKNLLAGIPFTSSYTIHNKSSSLKMDFNNKGEYIFTANSTGAGTDYIPINPIGKTYYYDYTISVNAGNYFYIGFERYDVNKTTRSNNACVYTFASKPSSDIVHQRYTGTVNLSTDGVNPCAFITLRILNGWSGTTSGVTGTATIHNISLREVTTLSNSTLEKTGILHSEEFKEDIKASIYKDSIVEANNFIEQ